MNEFELIDLYTDALTRNPKAAPPPELDAETAEVVRALVLSERAARLENQTQERMWHKALMQAESRSDGFVSRKSSSSGTSQNVIRLRPSEHIQGEDDMNDMMVLEPTSRSIPGTRPPEARYVLQYTVTIAAVVLILVLVGALLIQMANRSGRGGYPASSLLATDTPEPKPAVITPENVDQLQLLRILGRGVISNIVWSPDGKTLALGNNYGVVWLYNPDALDQEPRMLTGYSGSVLGLSFSPDSSHLAAVELATGGFNFKNVTLSWDVTTGEHNLEIPEKVAPQSLAWSLDGKLIAEAIGNSIVLRKADSGEQIMLLQGHDQPVKSVAFNPDGKTLVSGANDNTVRVWDVQSGNLLTTLQGHQGAIASVAFSPDGQSIASGSYDDTVRLWDWNGTTGTQRTVLQEHAGAIQKIAFSPDGKQLASVGSDKTIQLWDSQSGTQQAVLTGHTDRVQSIAFSPDGKRLASVSPDQTLRMWDVETDSQISQTSILAGHVGMATSAAFSPDSTLLASTGVDSTVRLWNATTGALESILMGHSTGVSNAAFSPDGKTLVSGGADSTVRVWDISTGRNQVLNVKGANVKSVAYSPDGKMVAIGSDDAAVRLWDLTTGESRLIKGHHHNDINSAVNDLCVAFGPDGKSLESASADGTVRLWDVATGNAIAVLQASPIGMVSCAYSPDGKWVAAGSLDSQIWLWNTAHLDKAPVVLQAGDHYGVCVAFSPDSKLLVGACDNYQDSTPQTRLVRVWDVATGTLLRELKTPVSGGLNPNSNPGNLAFNSDGTAFAIPMFDGSIEIWGLPPAN